MLIGSDMPTLNVLVVVTTPENLELASSTHKDNITTFFIHFSCTFNSSFATCNLQDLPHLHVYLTREKKKTRQMAKWSNTHSPQRALKQTSPQFFRGVGKLFTIKHFPFLRFHRGCAAVRLIFQKLATCLHGTFLRSSTLPCQWCHKDGCIGFSRKLLWI